MPTLLLEIGCEELPAAACREAEAQLPELCLTHLGAEPSRLFVGPRRLGVLVESLPERTPDEWVKGPPVALVEKAGAGFAKRHGVEVGQLTERDGFLGVEVPGRPLAEVLPERLDAIVRDLAFGKSMRWDESGLRFSRPVRWRCARLDGSEVEGYAGTSFGHRFSSGEVEIPSADAYAEALRAAGVEPAADERERQIRDGLDAIGGWSDPAGVMREVVHLVESPTVLEGSFDERYLRLPERVVTTAMQSHQRYFPLGGNRFAVVANGGDPDVVRAGNERVLEGRLDDAAFTFERDVAAGLEGLAGRLGSITYLAGAGSFADKTERLVRLVGELGGDEHAVQAAGFAKADQAAELVDQFPELEGHIGAQYARLAGLAEEVCAAIEEQYLPDSAGGPLPETRAGAVLAAADKIDALNVSFGLGQRPTGSRDPYGLRRAAIGLCRLATEGGLAIPLRLLDSEAADFAEERFEGLLDVPVEFVRAARRADVADLGAVAGVARELAGAADSDAFAATYEAYDRANRLGGKAAAEAAQTLDRELLREDAERAVADALASMNIDPGDVPGSLASAASLAPALERLFEEVLVMDEDREVRANRLRLLVDVRDEIGRLGDLSQIPR